MELSEFKNHIQLLSKGKIEYYVEYCNSILLNALLSTTDASINGINELVKLKNVKKAFEYGILLWKNPEKFDVKKYIKLLKKTISELENINEWFI